MVVVAAVAEGVEVGDVGGGGNGLAGAVGDGGHSAPGIVLVASQDGAVVGHNVGDVTLEVFDEEVGTAVDVETRRRAVFIVVIEHVIADTVYDALLAYVRAVEDVVGAGLGGRGLAYPQSVGIVGKARVSALQLKLSQQHNTEISIEQFRDTVRECLNVTEVTPFFLNKLIAKIEIGCLKMVDGEKQQMVSVEWK